MKISEKTQYRILIGFITVLISFIITNQLKIYTGDTYSDQVLVRKIENLVLILKETKTKNEELEKQIFTLKKQIGELKYSHNKNPQGKLKEIYELAGITAISGDGITIIIDDSSLFNKKQLNYDNLLHSEDLLKLINTLKASGAKAISVNNQRLITTSEIVTADNAIVINNSKINPPYIIKAIGPQEEMIAAINIRGGIAEYLEVFGIKLNITKTKNKMVINGYNKIINE